MAAGSLSNCAFPPLQPHDDPRPVSLHAHNVLLWSLVLHCWRHYHPSLHHHSFVDHLGGDLPHCYFLVGSFGFDHLLHCPVAGSQLQQEGVHLPFLFCNIHLFVSSFICLLMPLPCNCSWKLFKEWCGSLLTGGFLSAASRVADGMPSCIPGSCCFAQLECILGRNVVVCCGAERGGIAAQQPPLTKGVCLSVQWWHPEALWFVNIFSMMMCLTYVSVCAVVASRGLVVCQHFQYDPVVHLRERSYSCIDWQVWCWHYLQDHRQGSWQAAGQRAGRLVDAFAVFHPVCHFFGSRHPQTGEHRVHTIGFSLSACQLLFN